MCKDKVDMVQCLGCQQRLLVDNSILMYVHSYISKAARLNIKNAVLNFYSSEDIAAARQVIEESVKNVVPEHPCYGKKRTDSSKRKACDAKVDDILDLFNALDKVEDDTSVPRFMCSDASTLPPAGPEQAGSMMTILEALATQQREIRQLQESMNMFRIEMDHVPKIDVVLPVTVAAEKAVEEESPTMPLAEPAAEPAAGTSSREESTSDDKPHEDTPPSSKSANGKSFAKAVQQNVEKRDDGRPFQNQVKRPLKGSSKGVMKPNKQTKQGGTGESAFLRAGPSTFQLQVTNVNSDLGVDDIKSYLTGKDVAAIRVEDNSSENWQTKRFVVTLAYEHYERVMNPEFWPKKIYFKRWFPAKERKQ